jgi:hypothetical protein
MTGVFNDLLKRLNENTDHAHEEGGVAEETEEPEVREQNSLLDIFCLLFMNILHAIMNNQFYHI